jgi:hypothetical protein
VTVYLQETDNRADEVLIVPAFSTSAE